MTIRTDLINVLSGEFDFTTPDINTVLDACALEIIQEHIDIQVEYRVYVTYTDVPLDGKDPEDLGEADLEDLINDNGLEPDSFADADDWSATSHDIA